jgi:hypothetical protein
VFFHQEFYRKRVLQIRDLEDKAPPLIGLRLLDLAQRYENKLGHTSPPLKEQKPVWSVGSDGKNS